LSALALREKLPNCTDHEFRAGIGCASLDAPDLAVPEEEDLAAEEPVSSPGPAAACAPKVVTEGGALGGRAGCGSVVSGVKSAACGVGVALLVAKSTETLRVGAGRLTDGGGDERRCGPDSNSGTISTISTTKIVAPTRRSLTRRSMTVPILFVTIGRRSIFGKVRR